MLASMVFASSRCIAAATALIFISNLPSGVKATSGPTTSISTHLTPDPIATCEFRTINYITDSLPQLCLRSSWSSTDSPLAVKTASTGGAGAYETHESNRTAKPGSITHTSYEKVAQTVADTGADEVNHTQDVRPTSTASTPSDSHSTAIPTADAEEGELNDASFLSFEDWKKQTLEKAGQKNSDIGKKRSSEAARRREAESFHNLEALGDDGEIDLDFGAFGTGGKTEQNSRASDDQDPSPSHDSQQEQDARKRGRDQYRSNDAGKTCKERFSYASFDAGATILKTHSGAKNAKAILIENKDSYMLSECRTENKFVIIELSEDIWIDTLVLANYEFFSSMVRTFRVSVSDRYPVKLDKWKDVGVYEARNSREIQAFLIENPQIWARYIRIEFLSHYGKEYYCPLSLVRVHGTRMLESWKETEANNDEDDLEESEEAEEEFVPEAVADAVQTSSVEMSQVESVTVTKVEAVASRAAKEVQKEETPTETPAPPQATTPWKAPCLEGLGLLSGNSTSMCSPTDTPEHLRTSKAAGEKESVGAKLTVQVPPTPEMISTIFTDNGITSSSVAYTGPSAQQTSSERQASLAPSFIQDAHDASTATRDTSDPPNSASSATPVVSKSQNMTSQNKTKSTNTSSGSGPLPTIQESFFKAVSRRLQLLETNSTLSLKYIEEQSKMLREAFTKVEKRQLQKTTEFLQTLNTTVLTELRGFRQQYDEIWQSTVISLETQREESRREILAISTRLNILADEVVFQKRMSIVQSLLLLLCLGLVIFSRVSSTSPLDFSLYNNRSRIFRSSSAPVESPLDTPGYNSGGGRDDYIGSGNSWTPAREHRRQPSDESLNSRSRSRGWGPPTPVSTYSRSDNELTPPRSYHDEPLPSTTTTNNTSTSMTGTFNGSGTFSRLRKSITMKNYNNQSQTSTPTPLSYREKEKEKENALHRNGTFGPALPIRSSSSSSLLSVSDAKERRGRSSLAWASPPISDADAEADAYMEDGDPDPITPIDDIVDGTGHFEDRIADNHDIISPVEQEQIQEQIQEDYNHERKPLPALPTETGSP
ncbi:Sad1 UNC domain protein [Rutstroemia sp. NJR-2017a BVV2]|nr:Sad1 UNC domain protein [Rutstroemia sp. NJR-2017a BVV2]